MKNKELKKRILDISYKKKLSHIGSCLTAVDIIELIYMTKEIDDKFVLSSGHAGLALYVVLEKYVHLVPIGNEFFHYKLMPESAEKIFDHHGVHPDRCGDCRIDCSSGSLGHGLGIAVGMALADRSKNVYCLISDGECAEGSIWEAFRIAKEQKLENLHVYMNFNGWGAYGEIGYKDLMERCMYWEPNKNTFVCRENLSKWPEWLHGQQAHYVTMDENMYKEALEVVNNG